MKRLAIIVISLLVIGGLLFVSLRGSNIFTLITPQTEFTPEEQAEIEKIVNEAGKVVPLAEETDKIISSETENEGDFSYTYEKHDVVDNIDSVVYLGLNDDVIWPGSLVEGTHAHDFVYVPISVDRAPVTLSVSLEGSSATGESITNTVDDPKLSSIRQGISDLLKSAITEDTHVPARVDFNYEQVYTESQMNIFVGADVSYGAGSLETKFDWNSLTKQNKIIASYKQIYYTIDIDTPGSPADIFDPTMPISDIDSALGTGTKPLYVSSVSYGMMALMFIETDYSFEEMKWALDASYNAVVSGSVDLDLKTQQIMQSSTIQIVVYGGSTAGLQELETGYNGFLNVISASKDFNARSPGVPLVYRFRHLSDNTLALITLTSQYTLVVPLQLTQTVRVTVDRFVNTLSDDEGSWNDADMDRFHVWATAYNRWSDAETGSMIGTENQAVFIWSTSGEWTVGDNGIYTFEASQHKPNSLDIVYDTEHYDFNKAKLVLKAYAREYDMTSANEQATVFWEITGEHFMDNGGKHTFELSDYNDFGFTVHITIELISR
ncbi:MAG: hypothetical protein CW691_09530 [Candidatus Bathyarchaeum sp.]|nr:MAG: hypothetical protein CW691_09530 [Candidatus Bathyarchaeum sp.]